MIPFLWTLYSLSVMFAGCCVLWYHGVKYGWNVNTPMPNVFIVYLKALFWPITLLLFVTPRQV